MMASGSAVQAKGTGLSLVSARYRLMAAWRSTMPLKTPRLSRCRVSLAKKPSTALSHDAEVGVKWKWEPGVPFEPGAHFGMLVRCVFGMLVRRVVVDDQVQLPQGRGRPIDLVEEADEFLMAMARRAAITQKPTSSTESGPGRVSGFIDAMRFGRGRQRHQALDQPPACWTRWGIGLEYHLHQVFSAAPVVKIQPHKPSRFDVGAHHRFGHSAPSEATEKELVFRAYVTDAPGVEADHPEVLTLTGGSVRKYQLHEIT
jgi:hypothetical protein